jgi:hypothetical protein
MKSQPQSMGGHRRATVRATNATPSMKRANMQRETQRPKLPMLPAKFKRTSMPVESAVRSLVSKNSSSSQMKLDADAYLDDVEDDDLASLDDLDDVSNKQVEKHTRQHNVHTSKVSSVNKHASVADKDDDLGVDLYADIHDEIVVKPLYKVKLDVPDENESVGGLNAESVRLPQYEIQVLPLKLDGLAATCRVAEQLHDSIVKTALELTKKAVFKGVGLKKAFVPGGTRYTHNFEVFESDAGGKPSRLGLIQLKPGNKSHAFLRFELNPAAIGRDGCAAFKDVLKSILGNAARKVLAKAKITLLDPAVDILGIPIHALLLYSDRVGDSLVWGRHFDRNHPDRLYILTYQIGSKKSCISVIIYDKRAERRSRGKAFMGRRANRHCVRAEGRIRPKVMVDGKLRHGIYLTELDQLPNPLADLNIAVYFPPKKKDWMFNLFLDATQQIGTEAALAKVSRASRAKYRALLKAGAVDWWRPKEIIANLPAALKATGLFPPEAFR